MIRKIKFSDLDRVYELCKEHYRLVGMEDRGYDEIDDTISRQTLSNIIDNDNFITLVDDCCNGIISFIVSDSLFNRNKLASEFLWYSKDKKLFVSLFYEMEKILLDNVDKISIGIKKDSYTLLKFLLGKNYFISEVILTKKVGAKNV